MTNSFSSFARLAALVLLLFVVRPVCGQQWHWAVTGGGNSYGVSLAVDHQQNVFVASLFSQSWPISLTTTFGPSTLFNYTRYGTTAIARLGLTPPPPQPWQWALTTGYGQAQALVADGEFWVKG